jgi:ribosome-binding protein aMBF1 (putative translation factor)
MATNPDDNPKATPTRESTMSHPIGELTIKGETYVVLPKADYLRLRRGDSPPHTVDAIDYARASIGADLRAAREHAGLTQEALATKLHKSQTMVSQAEQGRVSVGARYVASVLRACGLPKDWKPRGRRTAKGGK